MIDLREVIRRLRMSRPFKEIALDLGIGRNTVSRYHKISKDKGWLGEGPLPDLATLQASLLERPASVPTGPASTVEPWRDRILELRKANIEMQAIFEILKRNHGYMGSYSAIRRFVRRIDPQVPKTCIRVETLPGEEAQVDFGYAGLRPDPESGKMRRSWVFVMTLCWSRHQYAEVVFRQDVATWLALHIRAFEFFGGVPERVRIDNPKIAIVHACYYDPVAQKSYRDLAEYYGFLITPCPVRKPEHKGKVESGVHYVKRNGLAGLEGLALPEANERLRRWVLETAGTRTHGTTKEKPLDRFAAVEKAILRPLPAARYDPGVWKKAKLHPDCHVVFEGAYYSVPYRLVGQELMICAKPATVEIYHQWTHVAAHPRARRAGERLTDNAHLPPHKVQGLMVAPAKVREDAKAIGPATADVVERLLQDRPLDRLRAAQGIVSLAKKHGKERLERACARALHFDDIRYLTVKKILANGMDAMPCASPAAGPLPRTAVFARRPQDFKAVTT